MKTTLLIVTCVFLSSGIYGQRHFKSGSVPYETGIVTIDFIVLDIDFINQLVAFKHVYKLQNDMTFNENGQIIDKPIECGYAGMQEYPEAGVILGVYDLKKGAYLKTFTIYKSCYDKKDCFSHKVSTANLDSAKAFFKKKNLNIARKPESFTFTKVSNVAAAVNVGGKKYTTSFKNDYDNSKTICYLNCNGSQIYSTEYDDSFAMATAGHVLYQNAYKEANRIVFLSKFYHDNNMEGVRSFEFFDFSPMFIINGNNVAIDKH